jgi:hypothetical protein
MMLATTMYHVLESSNDNRIKFSISQRIGISRRSFLFFTTYLNANWSSLVVDQLCNVIRLGLVEFRENAVNIRTMIDIIQ